MEKIRVVNIKEEILSENKGLADKLRQRLSHGSTFFINIMGSPGAGKTALILKTIRRLKDLYNILVVEADIDSMVDSEAISKAGVPTIQMHTGGFCHVDANMVEKVLESVTLAEIDLVILENVGNLVCPAETDTGAHKNVAILSLPEGDDKPLKYPLMFTVCDALVINKTDYWEMTDFNLDLAAKRAMALNEQVQVFPLSCKSGQGIEFWIKWLKDQLN